MQVLFQTNHFPGSDLIGSSSHVTVWLCRVPMPKVSVEHLWHIRLSESQHGQLTVWEQWIQASRYLSGFWKTDSPQSPDAPFWSNQSPFQAAQYNACDWSDLKLWKKHTRAQCPKFQSEVHSWSIPNCRSGILDTVHQQVFPVFLFFLPASWTECLSYQELEFLRLFPWKLEIGFFNNSSESLDLGTANVIGN